MFVSLFKRAGGWCESVHKQAWITILEHLFRSKGRHLLWKRRSSIVKQNKWQI